MSFHDDAAKEATDLALRIRASCDDWFKELVDELTDRAEAETEAAATRVRADADAEMNELRSDLQQQLENLRSELDDARSKTRNLAADLASITNAHEQAEAARQQAEAARQEADADAEDTARKLTAAQRDLQRTMGLLAFARAEVEGVTKQLESEAAERAKMAAALTAAQAQVQTADDERQALSEQLAALVSRADTLERSARELEGVRRDLQARIDSAARTEAALRQELAEASQAPQRPRHESAAPTVDHTAWSQRLDRLLTLHQRMAEHRTMSGVLTVLVEAVAQEFTRVALFMVHENHLEGVQQVGLDFRGDVSSLMVPFTLESVLTRVVRTGATEEFTGGDESDSGRALFGGSPAYGIATPIIVQGEMFAVLYADHAEPAEESIEAARKAKIAQLVVAQATPLLPGLMVEQRAIAELDRYARTLVAQIERVYATDAQRGSTEEVVHTRLQEHVQYAREVFAQRVEGGPAAAAGLLERHLTAARRAEPSTPFGRALASALAIEDEWAGDAPDQTHTANA